MYGVQMKRYLLLISIFVFTISWVFAQEKGMNESLQLEKSKLFTQKGEKAEARGEVSEAVEAYIDAYEACKNNIHPLLKLSSLYMKLGSFKLASRYLSEIPIDKLNEKGRSEVLTLIGKIAVNEKNLGKAADSFKKAVKFNSYNTAANARLALINLMHGMTSRAEELVAQEESFQLYNPEDLGMCLALDFHSVNLARAYDTCELLSKNYFTVNKKAGVLERICKHPLFLFISYLPLFLNKTLMVIYFAVMFTALGLSASALTKKTVIWHVLAFVCSGSLLMFLANYYSINDVYYSLLTGYCYVYDGIWILPKIIIALHLVALSLFAIFPMFRLLKENMRPVTFELLGIWLFCFFFSIFVLSFQSRLDGFTRFVYMAVGLFFSILSSLIMPLGRLLIYNISKYTGIQFLKNVSDTEVPDGNMNFTEAKLLQTKMWSLINAGNLEEAISIGRKVGSEENFRSYPKIWSAYIVALILNEDFESASRNILGYSQVFMGTEYFEIGQIYEALLKSEKGDYPVAYKLVNAISEEGAKSFDPDETAVSLLILGRCCLNIKDTVQAHINFNKAFASARSMLLKHIILTELVELDLTMNAKQALAKWKIQLNTLSGEGMLCNYRLLIKSMLAFSENKASEAFQFAKDSVEGAKISRAIYWYGHLLCLVDKVPDAEALLQKMTIGSYSTDRLMNEVTSKGLV